MDFDDDFDDIAKQIILGYLYSGVEVEPREEAKPVANKVRKTTYEVNVIVACEFEDTSWDYLEGPVYNKAFDSLEEAQDAFYENGYVTHKEGGELGERYHEKYPDCIAFELETSMTKSGDEFAHVGYLEWFENERIWG